MRRLIAALLGASIGLVGCRQAHNEPEQKVAPSSAAAKTAASPFRITEVSTDKERIDPAKGELVHVRYTVDAPASVRLQIYDGRNALIWQSESESVDAGAHTLTWHGKGASGGVVPSEAYQYVIDARNHKGSVVFDLTDLTGNEALIVDDPVWDAKTGVLKFLLRQPARINVRFGLAEGPYMRTVVDWVARDVGPQTVAWDGWDASGVLRLADHPMISPTVRAYTLPKNTIFVGPDADNVKFVKMTPLGYRKHQAPPVKTRMFFHADQPLETRGDIPVVLSMAANYKRDAEGRYIVSGVVPVRLDVPPDHRARVLERRFEPAFYTDGIFVFETEIGVLPVTWQWDSTVVNPGEHYLTANIRGYEGNYGAATLRVWVEHPGSPAAPAPAPGATAENSQ